MKNIRNVLIVLNVIVVAYVLFGGKPLGIAVATAAWSGLLYYVLSVTLQHPHKNIWIIYDAGVKSPGNRNLLIQTWLGISPESFFLLVK